MLAESLHLLPLEADFGALETLANQPRYRSLCLAHLALLLFCSYLRGQSAEPLLSALLTAPERGRPGGSFSKADLWVAPANTQQPSLLRQGGAEVLLATQLPIHLWVATEPGTLLLASPPPTPTTIQSLGQFSS